jgi:hypothetical protein
VILQIVPDTGYFVGQDGPFHIATGVGILDTVNMITVEDHVTDDQDASISVVAIFEEIRGYALSVTESRARIAEAIARWKSRQH